jgi:drug/metabolite transporter (DMT)-like permease
MSAPYAETVLTDNAPVTPGTAEALADHRTTPSGLAHPDSLTRPDALARSDALANPDDLAHPDDLARPGDLARPDDLAHPFGAPRPGGLARLTRLAAACRSFADRRPVLLAGFGAACISASAVLVKLADSGTATVAFYRCLLALPVLAVLTVVEQRRLGPRPLAARRGTLLAGLFFAVDLVLWNHAIAEVGAGVSTVLGNLQVLFVAAAAWALFRERPGRRFLIALPVVMAGVVLVSGLIGHATGGVHPLAGVGYGLGTSIAYAGFLLIMRQTSASTPHIAGPLFETTAFAAVSSVLLGVVFGGFQLAIGWQSFGWLLLLALTSQTIGWLLITSSLPRLPAAISSLTLLLQPAAAMLLAAAVLGEQPSIIQVAGAVLVCCGVLAATRTASTAHRPPSRLALAGTSAPPRPPNPPAPIRAPA